MVEAQVTTRERILLTAERLFSEGGIDDISIRQINLAAGQRNSSAAQYHFGTREDLIVAILDYRRASINERRLEILGQLAADNRSGDVRGLAEALVLPVAELLTHGDASGHYISVIAQLIGHPRHHSMVTNPGRSGDGMQQLYNLAREALPDLPVEVLRYRFGMALRQMFHELADFRRLSAGASQRHSAANLPLRVAGLIDVIAGAFAAPVSPQTSSALARRSKAPA